MKKKKLNDEELRELDNYLLDEFNETIYSELTKTDYVGYFEPLDFFRLFYSQIAFIEKNKTKPSLIIETLKELDLSDEQKEILLDYLETYFSGKRNEDTDIRICCRQIKELKEDLSFDEDEAENNSINESKDKFQELLEHLETIPSYKEKIAFLIKQKTKYEQNKSGWEVNLLDGLSFSEKCDLEIKKLKELKSLEETQQQTFREVAKHKDLTIDRVIFLLNRLIPSFSDCEATKKAEFINFLTGFDYETTRQRFSSIHRKDADKPQAFKKDMEIVCKYLDLLGLKKLTSQIRNDLEFE